MAHGILKTSVGVTVTEAGEVRREDKMKFYIEKSGKLRMFLEVPSYVGVLLEGYKLDKERAIVEWDAATCRLFGRDPDSLERAQRALFKAYSDRKKTLVLIPKIIVRFDACAPGVITRGFRSMDESDIKLGLKIDRALFEPNGKKDYQGREDGTHYEWRDDETKPLRRASFYSGSSENRRDLPYDEHVWQALVLMREQLAQGIKRFDDFMRSKELGKRLLAGPGALMLGHDDAAHD